MRVALLGTRGVPAQYGGFETAVEEVGARLAARGHEVTVYCRNSGQRAAMYKGMRLVNLPALRRRSLETLSHTALSSLHAATKGHPQAAILFNAANAPLILLLRACRIPTAVHIDGLEWKRAKWGGLGRRYYKLAERFAIRWADVTIADSRAIEKHVLDVHQEHALYIAYGAPLIEPGKHRLSELGLETRGYHLIVARWEPENHVETIVRGYSQSEASLPLVVVGSNPYPGEHSSSVLDAASRRASDVRFLGAIYDQELLDQLYANCLMYFHGHSVGGTNPSLLRAMGAAAAIAAFDVQFNHEVAKDDAWYFTTTEDVAGILKSAESSPEDVLSRGQRGRERVTKEYRWDDIADSYESLVRRLCNTNTERKSRKRYQGLLTRGRRQT